jgi:hypothetical protein
MMMDAFEGHSQRLLSCNTPHTRRKRVLIREVEEVEERRISIWKYNIGHYQCESIEFVAKNCESDHNRITQDWRCFAE